MKIQVKKYITKFGQTSFCHYFDFQTRLGSRHWSLQMYLTIGKGLIIKDFQTNENSLKELE
jgi:hypothetical protein